MKNFNEVITVEISVDNIANHLLSTMDPEFKHAENVVETIIGRLLSTDKQGLNMLYNALNGYDVNIDFNIGDVVALNSITCYCDVKSNDNDEWSRGNVQIEKATVIDIDIYSDKKIKIGFIVTDRNGRDEKREQWIHHSQCSYLAIEQEQFAS